MEEYLLFEFVNGYSLFKLLNQESLIGIPLDDISILKKTISLISHSKFSSFTSATENIHQITKAEGIPEDLKTFLTVNNVKKVICDKSLIPFLKELGIKGKQNDSLMRAVRMHQNKLISTDFSFLMGAAFDFSRKKIEYSDKKEDSMIIQSVLVIEQLKKEFDFFMTKIFNFYDFYFPELKNLVKKEDFFKIARILNKKKEFNELMDQIENKFNKEMKELIKESIVYSIGPISNKIIDKSELSTADLKNLDGLLKLAQEKLKNMTELEEYLTKKLELVAPNLLALLGPFLAAKMIAQAGSLLNLAKSPSSTVQLLGAETALFRALKTKSKTPKHGLIYYAEEVLKAKKKGRVSRALANKISILSRIDYFSESKTDIYGKELKKSVKDVLNGKKVNNYELMDHIGKKIKK